MRYREINILQKRRAPIDKDRARMEGEGMKKELGCVIYTYQLLKRNVIIFTENTY